MTNLRRVDWPPEVLERSAGVHPAGPGPLGVENLRCHTPFLDWIVPSRKGGGLDHE